MAFPDLWEDAPAGNGEGLFGRRWSRVAQLQAQGHLLCRCRSYSPGSLALYAVEIDMRPAPELKVYFCLCLNKGSWHSKDRISVANGSLSHMAGVFHVFKTKGGGIRVMSPSSSSWVCFSSFIAGLQTRSPGDVTVVKWEPTVHAGWKGF